MRSIRLIVVLFLSLFLGSRASAEKPSREEIAKIGKDASVMVISQPTQQVGSAFCIHPDGLFVTTYHVVHSSIRAPVSAPATIQIVLYPGQKTVKIVTARILRSDKDLNLALLKIDGVKNLPALTLDPSAKLSELADLFGAGFPFGRVEGDVTRYRVASINRLTVSALPLKSGELNRINLDGPTHPGHTGGPVLDDNGKVVGVLLSSAVYGSNACSAITSSVVQKFLETPEFEFSSPVLTTVSASKMTDFSINASVPLFTETPLEIEMILLGADGKERKIPMQKKPDGFSASVIPNPVVSKDASIPVKIAFPGGTTINGTVRNTSFRVDATAVKLSDVNWIERGAKGAEVVKTDGKRLAGTITGLEQVVTTFGEQTGTLDLTQAEHISCPQNSEVGIKLTFIVRSGTKELGRLEKQLTIFSPHVLGSGALPITVTGSKNSKVIRQLPSTFADVIMGGGGRYLVFHLDKLKKLAVFNVHEMKIHGYIPLTEENALFGAGLEKVVVALPGKSMLERWDLRTLERELSVPVEGEGTISMIAMGHASNGPLVLSFRIKKEPKTAGNQPKNVVFESKTVVFDLASLKKTLIHLDGRGSIEGQARMSADGSTIGSWNPNSATLGVSVYTIIGAELKQFYAPDSSGHVSPAPDGRVIYTALGRYTPESKSLDISPTDPRRSNYLIPAAQGDYSLRVSLGTKSPPEKTGVDIDLLSGVAGQIIAKLGNFQEIDNFTGWDRDAIPTDKRIWFVPAAKVLIFLPASNDSVILSPCDLSDSLEKSGIEYLLISSTPPNKVNKGSTMKYVIEVQSKHPIEKYTLDDAPPGMTLSKEGVMTWQVPNDFAAPDAGVLVTIHDKSGRYAYHKFRVRVNPTGGNLTPIPDLPAPVAPTVMISEETIAAWKKRGAMFNWADISKTSNWLIIGSGELSRRPKDATPAFIFRSFALKDEDLKKLPAVEEPFAIHFGHNKVTDAGLQELKNLNQLKALSAMNCEITGAGLKELKTLTALRLNNSKVNDEGMKSLKELTLLTVLELNRTSVTDVGVQELKDLKELVSLDLSGTKITDASVKELKNLKKLSRLLLRNTMVTDAGLKELREALPKCDIHNR